MRAAVGLAAFAIAVAVTHHYEIRPYQYSEFKVEPPYIKQALRLKNNFQQPLRDRKKTISNLTLKEVFDKIKHITAHLNQDAKRNGYHVDYKFRIID